MTPMMRTEPTYCGWEPEWVWVLCLGAGVGVRKAGFRGN